jgi:hypothetical protein
VLIGRRMLRAKLRAPAVSFFSFLLYSETPYSDAKKKFHHYNKLSKISTSMLHHVYLTSLGCTQTTKYKILVAQFGLGTPS